MNKDKDEYFDIEGVEGDEVPDIAPVIEAEAEVEAVAEVAEVLTPEPPSSLLSDHAESAALGGKYPAEDPGDDTTIWSPRPGVIGSRRQGFRKIK